MSYGYDSDYWLTSEVITGDPSGNNGTVSYPNYDAVGNRLQLTSTLGAVPSRSFSYDANDRLTSDTYDNNGNTIASGGVANTYDFENRMLSHGGVTLGYDGDGNRVSETVGGVTTKYLIDSLNPTGLSQVLDELVNGSVIRTYAYGLQRVSENQIAGTTWTPSFFGYDAHGSVRFLTNSAGTVTDTYQYDAFGNQIASTGPTANNFRFSGEQFDNSTSLYQLRARWYQPTTGRFITRDPLEHKACCGSCAGTCGRQSCFSWNPSPYAYANNDPVNRIDPSGQAAFAESATLYRYVLVYTAATILYYARPIKCNLVGEFADPSVDPIFKICYYSCTDGIGRSHIWPINQACPDPINAFFGIPF